MPGPEDPYQNPDQDFQDIHYLTPAGFNAIESKPGPKPTISNLCLCLLLWFLL